MKTHRIDSLLILIFLTFLILTACSFNDEYDSSFSLTKETSSENQEDSKSPINTEVYWEPLEMKEIKDNKGVVNATIPLPETWQINTNGFYYVGPDNIRVSGFNNNQLYMVNYNPSLSYAYSQTPQRAWPGIDYLVQEDILPFLNSRKFNLIHYEELPELSEPTQWYSDQLYKAMPRQTKETVYGLSLQDSQGNPAYLILTTSVSESESMQTWSYRSSLLESDKKVFELAKKQLIFGLSNIRYNPEPIIAYNEEEARKAGQSWAQFKQRMDANQKAFEAQQRAHVNKTEAINRTISSTFESRMKSMDKRHEEFIDYIYERENVRNSETGDIYKVDQGYNRYWMNSDGDYIATPSYLFDPNTVEGLNQQNWQELNRIK